MVNKSFESLKKIIQNLENTNSNNLTVLWSSILSAQMIEQNKYMHLSNYQL